MSADERLVAVIPWRCATCGHEERDLRSMMRHTVEAHPEPRRVLVEMLPKRCHECGCAAEHKMDCSRARKEAERP